MKLEFSLQTFEKHSVSNFMNIRLGGPGFFMRTARHDEANSSFLQFSECA